MTCGDEHRIRGDAKRRVKVCEMGGRKMKATILHCTLAVFALILSSCGLRPVNAWVPVGTTLILLPESAATSEAKTQARSLMLLTHNGHPLSARLQGTLTFHRQDGSAQMLDTETLNSTLWPCEEILQVVAEDPDVLAICYQKDLLNKVSHTAFQTSDGTSYEGTLLQQQPQPPGTSVPVFAINMMLVAAGGE